MELLSEVLLHCLLEGISVTEMYGIEGFSSNQDFRTTFTSASPMSSCHCHMSAIRFNNVKQSEVFVIRAMMKGNHVMRYTNTVIGTCCSHIQTTMPSARISTLVEE